MNNDFFLLKDYPKIPYFYRGTLADTTKGNRPGEYWKGLGKLMNVFLMDLIMKFIFRWFLIKQN